MPVAHLALTTHIEYYIIKKLSIYVLFLNGIPP